MAPCGGAHPARTLFRKKSAPCFGGGAFGGCGQVVDVVCACMNTTAAVLTLYEKRGAAWTVCARMEARVGKCGLVCDEDRVEGSLKTPVGVYNIPWAFGTAENPGTKLPYRAVGRDTYYDGRYDSPTYNTLVEGKPDGGSYESMDIAPYRYGALINFNPEGRPGKGNAIFLHCSAGSRCTAGCVSVETGDMACILRWLDPAKNPRITIRAAR